MTKLPKGFVSMSVAIPKDMARAIRVVAAKQGLSRSALVRQLIGQRLRRDSDALTAAAASTAGPDAQTEEA
jgi:metal-responsive CopG/Arc/MetJ family transcriptional regulator